MKRLIRIKYKKEIIYFGRQNAHYSQLCVFQNFPYFRKKTEFKSIAQVFPL